LGGGGVMQPPLAVDPNGEKNVKKSDYLKQKMDFLRSTIHKLLI
jgi:hypothetical protein